MRLASTFPHHLLGGQVALYLPFHDRISRRTWATFPLVSLGGGQVALHLPTLLLPSLFVYHLLGDRKPYIYLASTSPCVSLTGGQVALHLSSHGNVRLPVPWQDFKDDMGSTPVTEEAVKAQCWKVNPQNPTGVPRSKENAPP